MIRMIYEAIEAIKNEIDSSGNGNLCLAAGFDKQDYSVKLFFYSTQFKI